MHSSCMSEMLHAAETWAMTVATINCLRHNDCAMIHWICNVKSKDKVSQTPFSQNLASKTWTWCRAPEYDEVVGHVESSTGWTA